MLSSVLAPGVSTDPEDYRVLSIRQPWPSFIAVSPRVSEHVWEVNPALGRRLPKPIENRHRGTPWRGPIFLAASGKRDRNAMENLGLADEFFPTGVIIGVCRVVSIGATGIAEGPWAEVGRRHWYLIEPAVLENPIPWKGDFRLHQPDQNTVNAVLEQLTPEQQTRIQRHPAAALARV